ncbi:YbeD family protein [Chitinibacteraceae bacterium HSL-7]
MTQQLPTGATLEELLTFPADIPVKAVSHKGANAAEFELVVIEVVRQHVPGFVATERVTVRASSSGNYFAATLTVTFDNADQFRALDASLRAHPHVRLVL